MLKYYLFSILLIISISSFSQRHEIGIQGKYIYGYPIGIKNEATGTESGWGMGVYYCYKPLSWLGLRSGINYRNLNEGFDFFQTNIRHSLLLPIQMLLSPASCLSFSCGFYMRNLIRRPLLKECWNIDEEKYFLLKNHPIFGYHAGVVWKAKYFHLELFCEQDITSWMGSSDLMLIQKYDPYGFFKKQAKSFVAGISVEVPLWKYIGKIRKR